MIPSGLYVPKHLVIKLKDKKENKKHTDLQKKKARYKKEKKKAYRDIEKAKKRKDRMNEVFREHEKEKDRKYKRINREDVITNPYVFMQ